MVANQSEKCNYDTDLIERVYQNSISLILSQKLPVSRYAHEKSFLNLDEESISRILAQKLPVSRFAHEKSFLNLVKSNQSWNIITSFRLVRHETALRFLPPLQAITPDLGTEWRTELRIDLLRCVIFGGTSQLPCFVCRCCCCCFPFCL